MYKVILLVGKMRHFYRDKNGVELKTDNRKWDGAQITQMKVKAYMYICLYAIYI